MTSIVFTVTAKAQTAARLGTEQTFDIVRLTEFTPPQIIFNRTYAASMDGKSGKGTLISNHEVSRIGIMVAYAQIPALNELIHSLADYQVAEIDATDVPYVNSIRRFVMKGSDFPKQAKGCTHIIGSFDVRFLD